MARGVVGLFAFVAVLCSASADTANKRQPLFAYEENPLTESTLRNLIINKGVGHGDAHLFAFDDGSVLDPNRLKRGACKVFPGDAEWPSDEKWDALDQLVDGALIKTIPLAAPCYPNLGAYDVEKCTAVVNNFSIPYLHENDPTSIFWPLYQGRTCMPTLKPSAGGSECTLGGSPVYAINISSVGQIQLAINFARNANLRLVVKNTGHDYLGKSTGAGALSIWTHNLKDLKYYQSLEIPGYSGPAMKVGAGATVKEVYQEAERSGVSVLGGICESVGYAGGYVAGGGHTPLSGLYGMAADHVMALEVVTPDGHFRTASPEENTDLYWALRGGGGGTFGVVTSIIVRVHPKLPVVTSEFTLETSPTVAADTFWQGIRAYFELFIPFTDAGTYSWFMLFNNGNGSYTFQMTPFFAPNHTIPSFEALIKPWTDTLRKLGIPFTPKTVSHESFYPAYASTWAKDVMLNSAGAVRVPGNRLLPRRNWEDPVKFNATFAALRANSEAGHLFMGYHQAPRNRANVDNAVNSAWREAVAFIILAGEIPENPTPADVKRASEQLRNEIIAPLRKVSPESEGGGAYLNEANVDEPEWQAAFYGKQYPRLLELKKKYDSQEVFYGPTAVGSEGWEVRDPDEGTITQNGRLCRV
ncbi:hypothetical protein B0H66DRAFT_473490 [Apodospora peruviana]|uniref:FAD-binding PCMH-type domain-containing protein n=1 Tax=Apodospora peruviana TaxID=516989 RepID=A0AAE0ID74_9PEZI|nr:hypothetical protein B0H66DRAFT_473490 [Apodospora peruviana]